MSYVWYHKADCIQRHNSQKLLSKRHYFARDESQHGMTCIWHWHIVKESGYKIHTCTHICILYYNHNSYGSMHLYDIIWYTNMDQDEGNIKYYGSEATILSKVKPRPILLLKIHKTILPGIIGQYFLYYISNHSGSSPLVDC